jgi:hypothetical protein
MASLVHSRKVLLDYALKSYQTASDLEAKYNFNYQRIALWAIKYGNDFYFSDESYESAKFDIQNQLSLHVR